ncbi:MAG: radical SAM protein [Desulfobacteraceae bacterium]|jgi:GNAT superfamily N-acetyltransferase|nr:MAG: radical SAM protein [Desulfobacteraceae bacterium]
MLLSPVKTPFRTLLVFPPVWTPVTPYLALPLLSAYLRSRGLSIRQYDASHEFFLGYLLKEGTLNQIMEKASAKARDGFYDKTRERVRLTAQHLLANPGEWCDKIARVGEFVSNLKRESSFYNPNTCIFSQEGLYALLRLASLAFFPASFTFNTFANPHIKDFDTLLAYCEDKDTNPFLSFYQERLPVLLENCDPQLVGISITTGNQMAGGLTLARFIMQHYPNIHITLGGRHMLRLGESLQRQPGYFDSFCHSVVMGSGEKPLEYLIACLSRGGPLDEVPNLLRSEDGTVVACDREEHIPISEIPAPDFSDLPLEEYLSPTPIVPFRLSEGCYWGKCTFCSRYDTRRFATIQPQKAAEQLEEVHRRFSVSCFTINDDCLTPPYLEAFAREILKRNLDLKISLWCKPVGQFSARRIEIMARAGVRLVRWGVETGHPRILKLMNKGTDLEESRKVLLASSNAGIWNHATMILGFPTETLEEAKETIAFLDRNQDRIHSSILFRFSLLSHSYIVRNPSAFGIAEVDGPRTPFSYDHPFICSGGMDRGTFENFWKWANYFRNEQMYGNPLWYYLRIREYLLLYVARFGLETVRRWKVKPQDNNVFKAGDNVEFFFKKPSEIDQKSMDMICRLIESGGEVGLSWIRENLADAFMIGYAVEGDRVVGTLTHKRPKEKYVRYLMEKTGLDLRGYLERGYTFLRPEYRGIGIADRILKGLVVRSPGEKIYVTIRTDNQEAISLGLRNGMRLAAIFHNDRTNHEVGVFTSISHISESFPGDSSFAG